MSSKVAYHIMCHMLLTKAINVQSAPIFGNTSELQGLFFTKGQADQVLPQLASSSPQRNPCSTACSVFKPIVLSVYNVHPKGSNEIAFRSERARFSRRARSEYFLNVSTAEGWFICHTVSLSRKLSIFKDFDIPSVCTTCRHRFLHGLGCLDLQIFVFNYLDKLKVQVYKLFYHSIHRM